MDRQAVIRRVRIAGSIVFAALTVALWALWARSYWATDLISRIDSRRIATTIGSQYGTVYFAHFDAEIAYRRSLNSTSPREWAYKSVMGYATSNGLFVWKRDLTSLQIALPHWSIAIATTMAAAVPWLRWRFSLRTQLVATTLIAGVLGLSVWLLR